MKNVLAFIFFSFLFSINGFTQPTSKPTAQDDAYTATINTRTQKIVQTLGINDSAKASRVHVVIAAHYKNLNQQHADRDSRIKEIRANGNAKEATEAAIKKTEEETSAKIKTVHSQFISALSSELTNDQIVKVKDGLTYNVVNITYAGYLDMLPNLTDGQKLQIRTWLEEAREYAMDAESSEKKHGWFGKYKGRINNYLSTAGYNLKKEGEEWEKRRKQREEQKKNLQSN